MALPFDDLTKGTLLIASPEIDSGIFYRSVILLCDHASAGSFGIMINKPLHLEGPDDVLNLSEVANPNVNLRSGGPMQPTQMMLLHSASNVPGDILEVCEGAYLGGDLVFLQEALQNPDGPSLILCFGYTGWAPTLLEQEYLDGIWFTHPCNANYLFNTPPENLWRTLLQDMGGKYASLALIPDDLTLN